MKLVTLNSGPAGRSGALIGDEVLDFGMAGILFPLARWIPPSLASVIEGGPEGLAIVRDLVQRVSEARDSLKDDLRQQRALLPLSGTRLCAPIPRPGILLSHGRAYRSHVSEMKGTVPGATNAQPGEPIGFMKNTNAVIGPGDAIVLPESAPDMVDFEGEVSVVFSADCHGVRQEDALHYVLGFTIVNDVSARDWLSQMSDKPDLNRMGKQFTGFAPMGPCIATLDEIADPANLHMTTRLNDEVMQDAWTRDLIWSLPELIAYYSRWYPFRAGDVLTTGTPAGVGAARDPKIFMRSGDRVSISVDGVGELNNPVARSSGSDLTLVP